MFTVADLVYVIPTIFISLAIHEAMHAFTAHSLGDDTAKLAGRLTLNPLKHIDLFTTVVLPIITIFLFGFPILIAKPVPFNPYKVKYGEYGAALVGVAGPVTNLLLAALAAIFLRFISMPIDITKFLVIFTELNVLYFIINMIPIPPLDGSRLLYAFSPESIQKLLYKIESYGYLSIMLVFILVYYFYGPIQYVAQHIINVLL
ncbi:MAG TPA: site-2 protease family protein [Candidatus Saccharimonadia bacterium]|nr:site-2 protease family protein [Candidatus Saccharimonadia bacterium]